MCRRTRTRVVREGARVRALIGERDGKVGRKETESGGGSEEGGVNEERKGNQWKMKVREMGEKGKDEMKKPSRCAKRGERREKWERFPEKSPEIRVRMRKDEKKWTSQGKKRARSLEKSPENGLKTGKSAENGDFEAKKKG